MQERLKKILNKILEIWNKYTKKQKTIVLSTIGVVIIMIVLLAYFLGRTTYTRWQTFDDVAAAKMAVGLLDDAGIANKVADDSVTVYVDAKKVVDANMAVVDSELTQSGYFSLEDFLDSDMSTTNFEKQIKNAYLNMSEIRKAIEAMEGIDKAQVNYIPVDRSMTILNETLDNQCSVFLTINSKFQSSAAEAIAVYVANALGNSSLDSVKIIDQYGNLLYNGPEDEDALSLSNQFEQTKATYNFYRDLVIRYGLYLGYEYVEAEFNLNINYDRIEEYYRQYLPADGSDQGLYDIYEKVSSENKGSTGDVPGTDSNDENGYYIANNSSGDSTYDSLNITYKVSEKVTTTLKEWGVIDNADSSGAIVLKKVSVHTEDELRRRGILDDDTAYEDYIANNSEPVQQPVPSEFTEAFSNATGIPEANLTIIIYEIPEYVITESAGFNWNLLLTVLLFVFIIGLLIFVVFRVSKPAEVVETEPELSVEKLLATTKENQSLDDIEFSEKSETKKLIEKFVDENPEAVAALLRNWLNDGWQ